MNNNLMKNGSGYYDPVACKAISTVDREDLRFKKLLETIRNICDLAGFRIEGRIVLQDKKTGKVYK